MPSFEEWWHREGWRLEAGRSCARCAWDAALEDAASSEKAVLHCLPGGLTSRLETVWKNFDEAVEWGQDCMGYALQKWEWKYGDAWRKDEESAIDGRRELLGIIEHLKNLGI